MARSFARGKRRTRRKFASRKIAANRIGIVAVCSLMPSKTKTSAFMAGLALSGRRKLQFSGVGDGDLLARNHDARSCSGGLLVSSVRSFSSSSAGTDLGSVFHFAAAPFAYDNRHCFHALAFLSIWIVSVTDRSARAETERQAVDAVRPIGNRYRYSETKTPTS